MSRYSIKHVIVDGSWLSFHGRVHALDEYCMHRFVYIFIGTGLYWNLTFLLDIDECSPNPCKNKGVCIDGINSYECKCPKGYAGDNCEISKWGLDF